MVAFIFKGFSQSTPADSTEMYAYIDSVLAEARGPIKRTDFFNLLTTFNSYMALQGVNGTGLISGGDTASMLTPYISRNDTAAAFAPFIERSDTAAMLNSYRRKNDFVIATDYGMNPSADPETNHTALQNAINAATSSGIRVVFIPAGEYHVGSLNSASVDGELWTIQNQQGLTIRGAGKNLTRLIGDRDFTSSATATYFFAIRASSNVVIEDMAMISEFSRSFAMTAASPENSLDSNFHHGVWVVETGDNDSVTVRNCTFKNLYGIGIYVNSAVNRLRIENNDFVDLHRHIPVGAGEPQPTGVLINKADNFLIFGNRFENVVSHNNGLSHSIYLANGADGGIISNNHIVIDENFDPVNNGSGGIKTGGNGVLNNNLTVISNYSKNVRHVLDDVTNVIWQANQEIDALTWIYGPNSKNITFKGNLYQLTSALTGYYGMVQAYEAGVIFKNINFIENFVDGGNVAFPGSLVFGAYLGTLRNSIITGNIFKQVGAGIFTYRTTGAIDSSYIKNNNITSGSGSSYLIYTEGNFTNNVVIDNSFDINEGASALIRANPDYSPSNSGNQIINNKGPIFGSLDIFDISSTDTSGFTKKAYLTEADTAAMLAPYFPKNTNGSILITQDDTAKTFHQSGGAGGSSSYENTFLGWRAGQNMTGTGYANTAIGHKAGYKLNGTATNATANVFLGHNASQNVTTGSYNTIIGAGVGQSLTNQQNNTFIGYQAGSNSTSSRSTFIGPLAGLKATANDITAIGYKSFFNLTSGTFNTAIGYESGNNTTVGAENTYIGYQAGYGTAGGSYLNTFIGYRSGYDIGNAGNSNTGVGHESLTNLTTGDNNAGFGMRAGDLLTTGSNNTIVGQNADPSSNSATGQIVLGYNAVGTGDNEAVIGTTALTAITIGDVKINVSNTPTDGDIFVYDSNTGQLELSDTLSYYSLKDGWAHYIDTAYATAADSFYVAQGSTLTLPIKADMTATLATNYLPNGVDSLFSQHDSTILGITTGASYTVRVTFKAKNSNNTGYATIALDIGTGGTPNITTAESLVFPKGAGVETQESKTILLYSLDTFVANGCKIKVTADTGNLEIYDIRLLIRLDSRP